MQSANVAQLVMLPGIVTAASKPKHMAHTVTVMCRNCRLETTFTSTPGMNGITLPRTCTLSTGAGGSSGQSCPLDPWVVLPEKSSFSDLQTLKIQVPCISSTRKHPCLRCRPLNRLGGTICLHYDHFNVVLKF